MKSLTLFASVMLLVGMSAHAATLYKVTVGAQIFQPDLNAQFGEASDNMIATPESKETVQAIYFLIEHPIPFIPNYKFSTLSSETTNQTTLTKTFGLSGQTFSVETDMLATAEYQLLDNIFYYEMLDSSLFSFDLGANVRYRTADFKVLDLQNRVNSKSDVNDLIVLAYAKFGVGVPLMGVSAYTELNYEDADNMQWQMAFAYKFASVGLASTSVLLGYQRIEQNWQDIDGLYAENEWSSAFAGIEFSF